MPLCAFCICGWRIQYESLCFRSSAAGLLSSRCRLHRMFPGPQRAQAEILRERRKIFCRGQVPRGGHPVLATPFRSTPVRPGALPTRPDLSQDWATANRAFQELTRTVELAPDNYRAHTDLANLLVPSRNPDGTPVRTHSNRRSRTSTFFETSSPITLKPTRPGPTTTSAQNNIGCRHARDAAGHRG